MLLIEKGVRFAGRKLVEAVWHRIFTLDLFLSFSIHFPCPPHLDPLNGDIVCSKSSKPKPLFF